MRRMYDKKTIEVKYDKIMAFEKTKQKYENGLKLMQILHNSDNIIYEGVLGIDLNELKDRPRGIYIHIREFDPNTFTLKEADFHIIKGLANITIVRDWILKDLKKFEESITLNGKIDLSKVIE